MLPVSFQRIKKQLIVLLNFCRIKKNKIKDTRRVKVLRKWNLFRCPFPAREPKQFDNLFFEIGDNEKLAP